MNKYAARALLARVYLYHNDNRKAFDMAEQLIKDVDASEAMHFIRMRNMWLPGRWKPSLAQNRF